MKSSAWQPICLNLDSLDFRLACKSFHLEKDKGILNSLGWKITKFEKHPTAEKPFPDVCLRQIKDIPWFILNMGMQEYDQEYAWLHEEPTHVRKENEK